MHDGVSEPAYVTVSVPARLHLGFLDLSRTFGRRFGGIGVAISDLTTRITIRRRNRTDVAGSASARALRYLHAMERALALDGGHELRIEERVPAHAGLGSGTQIALAVAAGLRRLHGLPLDVEGDALRLGRGARSGLGIGLFSRGGLVVDGGRSVESKPAPIISHLPFPEVWRIVAMVDPHRHGVNGPDEAATFAKLAPMSDIQAAHICRLILMKALPALAEHDLANFGAAIKEVQMLLGDYFAPAQGGGRFASPDVAAVLAAVDGAGASGIGQSSWGPTGFAFAPTAADADRLASLARRHPSGQRLDIRICRGLNQGAQIIAHAHAH